MEIWKVCREITHFPSNIVPKSAIAPPNTVFAVYIVRYAFLAPGMGYRPFGLDHGRRVMGWIDGSLEGVSRNYTFSFQNRAEIRPLPAKYRFRRLYCQTCLPDPRYGVSAVRLGPWAEGDGMD